MDGYGEKKLRKTQIPWLLIAVAFAFIFNPNISIVDPLPDFIGYIMISIALNKPAMLNGTMAEAKIAFERMILIDAGKLLAIIWIFGMESLSERSVSILVWCFVFAVLEGIFLIPTYIKLFKGLSEIGDFYPNTSIHAKPDGKRLSYTERIRNFTVVFVSLKAIMTVLPELSALGTSSIDDVSNAHNLYRYIGVMRAFCVIPVLVLGVIWLIRIIKYFVNLRKDKVLNLSLNDAYAKKEIDRKGIFVKKYVRTACWFLVAFAVMTLDFRLEEVNIIPDALVLICLIPSLIYFAKTAKLNKKTVGIYSICYGISAALAYTMEAYYIESYTYNAMNKNAEAFIFYLFWVAAVALQGVMLVLLVSAMFKEIRKVTEEHTGCVTGRTVYTEGEQAQIKGLHKELDRNFAFALDALMLYVVSDVVYALYGAFYAFLNVNLGFLNVINLACGILFIGMTVRAVDDLKEAVDTKYMFE